jgi:uncharacterized membrane protein
MHCEASLVVKVPPEEAYAAYTDFESMPKWSKQISAVKILGKGEDRIRLEFQSASGASRRTTISELNLIPGEKVESEGETRFTRTKRAVSFARVPEGTKVTASLDVTMKGKWGWVLRTRGKEEAEASASTELSSFASYVESLP